MYSASEAIWKPAKADLEAAKGRTIPDVMVPNLDVLFCGINPGLYSAAVGHHFARPGNRFWPALYASGFTDRLMSPFEDTHLPRFGLGLTNLVARGTASAAELSAEEIAAGARKLEEKIRKFRPARLAVLGVGAYQHAFDRKKVKVGRQEHVIHGASVWVLPNPSGLNAHYQVGDIAALLIQLRNDLN
ncbi:MAG TPA: G/U mismatch-specific DNA glycosylase [Actinomycetota bacterium]|nr:G/U mismatch-specific DNA glycosylase [Actinomycetota bacterium]